ncbi:MAG TPA: FeoA family protein [Thermoanaerobaculia bacterium]|nr:FeoA family protein [Thermoanaerobaculia bacterium]
MRPLAQAPTFPDPLRLTQLAAGSRARLSETRLAAHERDLLTALGLSAGSCFRVCRAGDPWILEVRATRIGLADVVAERLLVVPDGEP